MSSALCAPPPEQTGRWPPAAGCQLPDDESGARQLMGPIYCSRERKQAAAPVAGRPAARRFVSSPHFSPADWRIRAGATNSSAGSSSWRRNERKNWRAGQEREKWPPRRGKGRELRRVEGSGGCPSRAEQRRKRDSPRGPKKGRRKRGGASRKTKDEERRAETKLGALLGRCERVIT